MKRNKPTLNEVENLINAAEKLRRLEAQRATALTALSETQREAKSAIRRHLSITPNDKLDGTLKDLVLLYRRSGGRRVGEIEAALDRETELDAAFEKINAEASALAKEIGPKIAAVCSQIHLDAGDRYQALIAEINNVLLPYCDNDVSSAEFLACQTPAAVALFRQSQHSTPEFNSAQLSSALRSARDVLNTKSTKS